MDIDQLSAAASKDIVRKPSTEAPLQRPRIPDTDTLLSDDSIDDLIKSSSDSESGT